MNKKNKTIGVLVGGVLNSFSEYLCRGASKKCEELGYNMVVFPGKYIDRDLSDNYDLMYEYQNNTCYEYPAYCDIDGLIIAAGSVGSHSTPENVLKFLKKFEGTPFILVASQFGDYPNISYDNTRGVHDGIAYLIEKCGCKNICMIGGSDANTDAVERKKAFIDAINEYGIDFNERRFEVGTLARNTHPACRRLLDRNPDVDGIFCVNDDTALAFYDVMRERNLVPGVDIKVFGYDNTIEGMKADPAVSTVSADMVVLGQEAVVHLEKIMNGQKVESVVLPAEFLPRKSIGVESGTDNSDDTREIFKDIFYNYINIKSEEDTKYLFEIFSQVVDFLKTLVNYSDTLRERDFTIMINKLLATDALDYCDTDMLLRYFERIRVGAENRLPVKNINVLLRIYNNLYMRIIRNQDRTRGIQRKDAIDFSYEMKVFIMNTLRFKGANDLAYNKMVDYLEWLNIHNAYIYIFENEMAHLFGEEFVVPEEILLKVKLRNGRAVNIADSKQKRKTKSIIIDSMDSMKRGNYICMPLFSQEIQYGLMICDFTEEMFTDSEFVVSQMSSVAKIISIMRLNEEIQMQLEEHLVAMREHNIVLDTLSKLDSLTGIFNRRGFMEAGEALLHDAESNMIVAYIDMNNLKIINDRYGHEEGDWSLKAIAERLKSIIGDNGIVARLGGDEFAAVAIGSTVSTLKDDIEAAFEDLNGKSTKPYLVTVSVGAVTVNPTLETKLESALSAADSELYLAKQTKKNTVEKIGSLNE